MQKQVAGKMEESWRSADRWEDFVKECKFRCSMKILLDAHLSRDQMTKAVSNLVPKPFGIRRERGEAPVWMLFFVPLTNGIEELKSQEYLDMGNLRARNLNYGLPLGEAGKLGKYYIDIGDEFFMPIEMIQNGLKKAGVVVYHIKRESYEGLETGIVSVIAGSVHADGEVKFTSGGITLVLRSVAEKVRRKRRGKKEVSPQSSPSESVPSLKEVEVVEDRLKPKEQEKIKKKDNTMKKKGSSLAISDEVEHANSEKSEDEEEENAKPNQESPQLKNTSLKYEKMTLRKKKRNRKFG